MSLTKNAVQSMYFMTGSADHPSFCPTLQLLHIKEIVQHGAENKFKIILSDGDHFLSGMLTIQLHPKLHSGELAKFAIIRVTAFEVTTLPSGQKIIILLGADKVINPGTRLGNPVDFTKTGINLQPSDLKMFLRNYDAVNDINIRSTFDAGAEMDELERAAKRLKSTVDDHQSSIGVEMQKLDDEERRIRDRLNVIEEKKRETAAANGGVDVKDDDLIEINAGGKIIAAKRGVLTQRKGTRLEALFSGRWEKKLQRDNSGRIFLDVNPKAFRAIVDWLNMLSISSEDNPPQSPSGDEDHKNMLNHQMALFIRHRHSSLPGHSAKTPPVVDRFGDEVKKAINERWASLQKLDEGALSLDKSFQDEERFINLFATGGNNDIITLNVGGTIMATSRATLLAVEDSMLAQQFDDTKWTEQGCDNVRAKEWTPAQVAEWVRSVEGMQEDASNLFIENEINGSELLALDRDGLKDIGVKRVGTICLLLEEIGALKEKVNKDNVTLIEHSPYCFGKILDFLRVKHLCSLGLCREPSRPSVCEHKRGMFETVVRYYFPGESSTLFMGIENMSSMPKTMGVANVSMNEARENSVNVAAVVTIRNLGCELVQKLCLCQPLLFLLVMLTKLLLVPSFSQLITMLVSILIRLSRI